MIKRFLILTACLFGLILYSFSQHEGLDGVSGASLTDYTRTPSQEELLSLILNDHDERVLITSTVNDDGTPHAAVFMLSVVDTILMIQGADEQQTIFNIKKRKLAHITVYENVIKGYNWTRHFGGRITTRLIEDEDRIRELRIKKIGEDKSEGWHFLEIIEIKPLG